VSGGADSLALLVLARTAGLDATAIHVDHGLRDGSAEEAEIVRAAAARYGAGFEARTVAVEPGPNLEERARQARRSVLPHDAMTGHTADDQAETVILNLLRGAGIDGLAGIRPGPTKPILSLRRGETHQLCAEEGLTPVVDPTNADGIFRRNRIRSDVMPLLDAVAERDVAAVIARQAELLRDDADLLDSLAASIDPADARALRDAPLPLARRAVRRWLASAAGGPDRHPPDAASVERVLAVARNEAVACELPGGLRVSRSGGRLTLSGP
jgi:tRNA(Ile)-lysidine synthase